MPLLKLCHGHSFTVSLYYVMVVYFQLKMSKAEVEKLQEIERIFFLAVKLLSLC